MCACKVKRTRACKKGSTYADEQKISKILADTKSSQALSFRDPLVTGWSSTDTRTYVRTGGGHGESQNLRSAKMAHIGYPPCVLVCVVEGLPLCSSPGRSNKPFSLWIVHLTGTLVCPHRRIRSTVRTEVATPLLTITLARYPYPPWENTSAV